MINQPSKRHGEVFVKAMDIVNSLQGSPSCTRLATVSLLNTCGSLERPVNAAPGGGDDVDTILDSVKAVYAARLAVCELTEAGTAIPSDCSNIVMTPKAYGGRKGFLARASAAKQTVTILKEDKVNGKHLGKCLRSLESRPQWWTSYSNARQNAVVMCQAVRTNIDRGKPK
jgi:hypothetical protein